MSSPRNDLSRALQRLDGNSYGAYKQLRDSWRLGDAELILDRVQSDPYAPPSLARLRVPLTATEIPRELLRTREMRIAAGDFLTRRFAGAARELGPRGGKDTGGIFIQRTGQEILERSSVLLGDPSHPDAFVEIRCEIALPAAGRRITGRAAQRLLTEALPSVVERTVSFSTRDAAAIDLHVRTHLDAERLRAQLPERGLVAFVADGAVLPRVSGDRDEPLTRHAVPFETPPTLRVMLELSDGCTVSGMGVPEGVTVIVGGGYHGKSTLLQALERGVYNHVPGDGRELVITVGTAMSVRAEDGRAVSHTDVSPFITNLPTGTDTRDFTTSNASGSTSQAAATVEAIEARAGVLLLDEDTCATNLMVRDERMRAMVPGDREPITPFVDRVGALFCERGVSCVLVTGGSGAFLEVADLVIAMDAYRAADVTARAREVVLAHPRPADIRPQQLFGDIRTHVPGRVGEAVDVPGHGAARSGDGGRGVRTRSSDGERGASSRHGDRRKPARARGVGVVQMAGEDVDVSALSQLVDPSQTEAVARLLDEVDRTADGHTTLTELVAAALERVSRHGLDALSRHSGHPGHLALPRAQDVAAAHHRVRR